MGQRFRRWALDEKVTGSILPPLVERVHIVLFQYITKKVPVFSRYNVILTYRIGGSIANLRPIGK